MLCDILILHDNCGCSQLSVASRSPATQNDRPNPTKTRCTPGELRPAPILYMVRTRVLSSVHPLYMHIPNSNSDIHTFMHEAGLCNMTTGTFTADRNLAPVAPSVKDVETCVNKFFSL